MASPSTSEYIYADGRDIFSPHSRRLNFFAVTTMEQDTECCFDFVTRLWLHPGIVSGRDRSVELDSNRTATGCNLYQRIFS
jgi:hypothetical protein